MEENNYKGFAITALVCGIVGIVSTCCCTCVSIPCGIVAIVFACIYKSKMGSFNGLSLAGLICGIVAVVLSIVTIIINTVSQTAIGSTEMLTEIFENLNY